MTERLGRITYLLTRDSHFFREHAQVVGVGQNTVEVREGELPELGNWNVISGSLNFPYTLINYEVFGLLRGYPPEPWLQLAKTSP